MYDPGAVERIAHHPLHAEQAHVTLSIGVIEDRRDRAQQQVFRPRAPRIRPKVLEDRDDVRGDKGAVLGGLPLEHVEPDRAREIGKVEVDHVVGAPGRHVIE